MMTRDAMLTLLSELIACHSPSGDESEIEAVLLREFQASGVAVWQDAASNIYAHLEGEGPVVMVCAHKDEIGMIVSDIQADGRLKVENVGGSLAWKYGEGPVDVLCDNGDTLRAILSVGSTHTHTGPVAALREKALKWEHVTLYTGYMPEGTGCERCPYR